MARYSTGVRTAAGSTTLPIISLYSAAAVRGKIREIGVFNTTTTALALALRRLTTTGTQGAALTKAKYDQDSAAASSGTFTTHTVAPTLGDDLGYRAAVGAAVGAGVIWRFDDSGLLLPVGVANGIGIIVAVGTGQICDAYIIWDE